MFAGYRGNVNGVSGFHQNFGRVLGISVALEEDEN